MALVDHVDYPNQRIYLSAETADTIIDTLDIYKEVRALRMSTDAHQGYKPLIIAGGNIPKIPGVSYTAPYVQLLYGARIVPFNGSHKLTVIRDTFTDDGFANADCFDRTPLSPGVDVDIDFQVSQVEIRIVNSGSGLSLEQAAMLVRIEQLLRNKQITDPVLGKMVLRNDSDTADLATANLWEDAAGTQPYRGQGAERRDRFDFP